MLDFTSTNVPESEWNWVICPKTPVLSDALLHSRRTVSEVTATIILMGADRTSIHRPEYCLAGQGLHM